MIRYLLECMAFQLLFLLIYDLLLQKETFFKWNRLYLIVSFLGAFLLPFIQLKQLQTNLVTPVQILPEFIIALEEVVLIAPNLSANWLWPFSIQTTFWPGGSLLAFCWFLRKMHRLYKIKKAGEVQSFNTHTEILLKNSNQAFSFFRQVFLGSLLIKEHRPQVLAHELVHVRQRHSVDLMLFEILRIICWFNPFVYVYQRKLSELHEFLADEGTLSTSKNSINFCYHKLFPLII